MIISYKWLSNYLPVPVPVDELSNILTSIGLEVEAVEAVEAVKGSLKGLMIGEVLTCEKHANADKLKVTTVSIGSGEPLKIVCGAPNVAAGQKVVVAPVGTTVHPTTGEPFEIKKAKIRGEESQGMICAEDEIGLGSGHDGIMILPDDAPVGQPAAGYFNIASPDYAIHIGLTPNRSDAMSHIGVAKDVCAYLSYHKNEPYEVKLPSVDLSAVHDAPGIAVHIEASEACKRYAGISLSNVTVKDSPEWLQQKLRTIGVRSINNVVDITNFVLHEYGQPLHAFDADKITGNAVKVQFLPEGTNFVTLDGKERKLESNDLMICNEQEGMCLAGVFGGISSGVTVTTQNLFLESAWFAPSTIRKTSLHHGLRSDAATHFEKGVDINNVIPALKRAATLICELSSATVASRLTDMYPEPLQQTEVSVSFSYIEKLSGKAYPPSAVKQILSSLGFEIISEDAERLRLLVPTNKTDVTQPADIVEEILRIDGLDNIPIPERLNISLLPSAAGDKGIRQKLSETLCGIGFQEIVTNSIVNSKYFPEQTDLVRMLNSLSSELDVMRPSLLESGLEVIQYNCNRKNSDLLLFEFGKTYKMLETGYGEQQQLGIWITGNSQTTHWGDKAKPADIYFLKGVLQRLMDRSGLKNIQVRYEDGGIVYRYKNQVLCSAMSVPAERLAAFDIKQEVFFAVADAAVWMRAMEQNKVKYQEVPKFPSVTRDLAIVLNKEITYQQVQELTDKQKIETLKGFDLFDVFESEKLGAQKKSYALSYTFQVPDRTLTDQEIDHAMQQLMNAYKTTLEAQIRE